MHYGMAIDTQRCIGCHSCSVACRHTNNVPEGNWWNRVYTEGGEWQDTPKGSFPDLTMSYVTIACQHCENPACVTVCPVGATYKDPETGVVRQDYDKCIGCRICMSACPYHGVRTFNWEEPSYVMGGLGEGDAPTHQKNVVEKCTFCYQRVARGEQPACISACPGRARASGDLDDPGSEISRLLRERSHKQLLPERGTKPSVYYLV